MHLFFLYELINQNAPRNSFELMTPVQYILMVTSAMMHLFVLYESTKMHPDIVLFNKYLFNATSKSYILWQWLYIII